MALSTVLPQQNRTGHISSANIPIPANAVGKTLLVVLVTTAFDTPDQVVTLKSEFSFDGAQTWEQASNISWVGGPMPPSKSPGRRDEVLIPGPPTGQPLAPTHGRATLDIQGTVNIGLQADLIVTGTIA